MIQSMFERLLQSTGKTKYIFYMQMAGTIFNVIVDPILIFGLLGAPKLGVIGAAIATIIGQTVSVLISLYVVTHKVHDIHIDMHAKLDKYTVGEIYAVGIPSILMQTVISIANALMNLILVGLSTTAVAVMGVYGRLQSFIFMPVFGLNQGTTPIFGFNYGAGNKERLVKALKTAWVMAFCIMLGGFILFQTVPEVLLGFFDASPQMLEIGVHAFRIISICFLPASIGIIGGSMFAATGHGVISLVSAVVRQLVFIVPSAFILSRIGGLDMVWWAFPISEIFGLAYVLIMLKWLFKHDINKLRRFDDIDSGIL
jgi:putative MATE family efflux protein